MKLKPKELIELMNQAVDDEKRACGQRFGERLLALETKYGKQISLLEAKIRDMNSCLGQKEQE